MISSKKRYFHLIRLNRAAYLIAIALILVSFAKAQFTLSGSLPGFESSSALILLREDLDLKTQSQEGKLPLDANGNFEGRFTGEPGLFSLILPDNRKIPLAIDEGQEVSIRADKKNPDEFAIAGSPDTSVLQAYEAFRRESLDRLVYPPRAALNEASASGASPGRLAELSEREVEGYAAHRRELNDFSIDRVGNSVALYATSLRWDPDHRLEELQERVSAFARERAEMAISKSMNNRLRRFSVTALGANGSPLSGYSLIGEAHSLDDFRGKVVLVDFWASWCVPCRVENRLYVKLLEKYSGYNFAIFAVNLDDNRSSWATASKRDRVTWPQISDSLGWESPLSAAYNVNALPMSFLLDPDGKIIARNLRGAKLESKLEELFE